MKRNVLQIVVIVMILVVAFGITQAIAQNVKPEGKMRVQIPEMSLWTEPSTKSDRVVGANGNRVKLKLGDPVIEVFDQYGRKDYGEWTYVEDANGNRGYTKKGYLHPYAYLIQLQGGSQELYSNPGVIGCREEYGSLVGYRKNEILMVVSEGTNTRGVEWLEVITVGSDEGVRGYLPTYAYYSYVEQ